MSLNAYKVLEQLLRDDGEFLPVRLMRKKAFIFNPLHTAEEVNGLDQKLSIKNEWGDIENIAFHQEKIKNFIIFKTEFDNYISAFCDSKLKDMIEQASLSGVFFTPDLGNYFSI